MVSLIKNSKSSFYLGIAFCLSLLVNFYFVEIIRYGDFQNLFYAFLFIFHTHIESYGNFTLSVPPRSTATTYIEQKNIKVCEGNFSLLPQTNFCNFCFLL